VGVVSFSIEPDVWKTVRERVQRLKQQLQDDAGLLVGAAKYDPEIDPTPPLADPMIARFERLMAYRQASYEQQVALDGAWSKIAAVCNSQDGHGELSFFVEIPDEILEPHESCFGTRTLDAKGQADSYEKPKKHARELLTWLDRTSINHLSEDYSDSFIDVSRQVSKLKESLNWLLKADPYSKYPISQPNQSNHGAARELYVMAVALLARNFATEGIKPWAAIAEIANANQSLISITNGVKPDPVSNTSLRLAWKRSLHN
jgi:hypothetical protein